MEKGNQFIGFMAILLVGGLAVELVQSASTDPAFIVALAKYSPWAAVHARAIGWIAAGAIGVMGIVIPLAMKHYDVLDGGDRLGRVGVTATALGVGLLILFALPSISYLLAMGWFAAQKSAGL